MRVIPIKIGSILREDERIMDARSSVTLIESGENKIIVDTGHQGDRGIVVDSLSARELTPEDIDVVINTHLHLDHCGCNLIFSKAVFYAHQGENPPIHFRRADEGTEVAFGVSIMHTPGHTAGSISVIARTESSVYAIVGDAIPTIENYETMSPPRLNIDKRLALESMKRIIDTASHIIPGHGAPFEITR